MFFEIIKTACTLTKEPKELQEESDRHFATEATAANGERNNKNKILRFETISMAFVVVEGWD